MKVLVAHFNAENNQHISHTVKIDEFDVRYDQDCIDAMFIGDIFEKANIEVIPSIYATINPNGMVERSAFDFICNRMFSDIRKHKNEIDGIYLHLHGASGILDLDEVSGEHFIIKEIRKIVGKFMPIALCMDPHGNLTNELGEGVNIVRCYRESPHSDFKETKRKVAELLVELLNNKRYIKPVICKLPIMVGGERSVSAKEPIKSINRLLDEAEKDHRVMSASYHVGYIRHDDDKLGACVTIVPQQQIYYDYCKEVADKISNYAWDHRHEFKFSGNFEELDESVKQAIDYNDKTVVITDSGDNCGAGGSGQNTEVLREFLKHKTDKKILIAGINDAFAHKTLMNHKLNDHVEINIGVAENELSQSVSIKGEIIAIGQQQHGKRGIDIGEAFTIRLDNTNIDVVVVNHNVQYGTMEQFHAAKLEFHDYDIVVVKMGYLDTYLIPETKYHIMALTDGATIQRSERIKFKKIYRPMWPIDEFDDLKYIK
ncbi:MAG: M81 family metallopeptidase [Anaerorhabdus sp.]